jgi:hypothetical protein
MLIGMHPDKLGEQSYSAKWADTLSYRQIAHETIDLMQIVDLSTLRKYDGVMWRWGLGYPDRLAGPQWLEIAENVLRIPCYPSWAVTRAWDDKVKQCHLLRACGIDTPTNWVLWNRDMAMDWLESVSYPVVCKLATGAGSRNVVKINTRDEAFRVIDVMFGSGMKVSRTLADVAAGVQLMPFIREVKWRLFPRQSDLARGSRYVPQKGYVYFQEFMANNEFDTRVTVIGDRAFAFRRFNRDDDFRASGSGKLDYDVDAVDLETVETAFAVSEKLGVECMAYDFVKDGDGRPVVLEMAWTFLDKAVYSCPGQWDRGLKWHAGNVWPQQLQVEQFVKRIDPIKAGK